jgi:hypothetical protein
MNTPTVLYKFTCEKCNYNTNTKQKYDRHLSTKKHLNEKVTIYAYTCEKCNKKCKYRSTLWKHNKVCKEDEILIEEEDKQKTIDKLKEENEELKKIIETTEISKVEITNNNIQNNNTNNNNFNISVFLNEDCKNAVNFIDFINMIKIELNEMKQIGETGYVDGMTKLLQNKLSNYPVNKRPIHYHHTNNKNSNEQIHIKDENVWKNENNQVIEVFDKSIYGLDTKLNLAHSKYQHKTGEKYENVRKELYKHGGMTRNNKEEQCEILTNILTNVKV